MSSGIVTANAFAPNPRQHEVIEQLSNDATDLDATVQQRVAGGARLERCSTLNLGVIEVTMSVDNMSYRGKQMLVGDGAIEAKNAQWVTVSPNTSLTHLLNKYGERLLGYDSEKRQKTIRFLAWDIAGSTEKQVRVLVNG
jgi:hypothetical protein